MLTGKSCIKTNEGDSSCCYLPGGRVRDLPGGIHARGEGAGVAAVQPCFPQGLRRPLAAHALCLPAVPDSPVN